MAAGLGTASVAALLAACLPGQRLQQPVGYYAQSVGGHLDLVARARPVDDWLADAATPARAEASAWR